MIVGFVQIICQRRSTLINLRVAKTRWRWRGDIITTNSIVNSTCSNIVPSILFILATRRWRLRLARRQDALLDEHLVQSTNETVHIRFGDSKCSGRGKIRTRVVVVMGTKAGEMMTRNLLFSILSYNSTA